MMQRMQRLAWTAIALAACVALASTPRIARGDDGDVSHGTVVHFGDSFIDAGLRQALGPKFAATHTRYVVSSKTSSYLGTWAFGQDTWKLKWTWHPTLWLVTLGANEPRADPASRVAVVKQLVRNLGGAPCVWIGTPMWEGETTALMDMIAKESAPCRYFDSNALRDRIARQSWDHAHPTNEGGTVWAEAFWQWLEGERDPDGPTYWTLKPAPAQE